LFLVDSSKQRFSEFLESVWQSGKTDVGLSGFINNEILKEPLVSVSEYEVFSGFARVGSGKVTADTCGKHMHFLGCSNEGLHKGVVLDGVDYTGKGYFTNVVMSCGKPSCPKCYRLGWAPRLSWKITSRLEAVSKGLKETDLASSEIEHIICSIPPKDYGITDYRVMKARARKALRRRRVIGGNLIFHAFRYNKRLKKNVLGFHFHTVGFIRGGYECRDCKKPLSVCMKCDGFEGRTRRANVKDKYVVKIARDKFGKVDKRKCIGGTIWYQLNHSSFQKGVRKFHISSWFGICSYNKLKVVVPLRRRLCPICSSDIVRHVYVGVRPFSDLCSVKPSSGVCRRGSVEDLYENGERVWVEVMKVGGYG
jgi:hypothetical protein